MSLVKCITDIATLVSSVQHRKFFDLWTRQENDFFLAQLLSINGFDKVGDFYQFILNHTNGFDHYTHPGEYDLKRRQAVAYFSKNEDIVSPVDKEAASFASFKISEESCRSINDKFGTNNQTGIQTSDIECILHYARRKISDILGDAPTFDDLRPSFGKGATASCKQKTSARWKLASIPSITNSMVPYLETIISQNTRYFMHHKCVTVVPSELLFVPKNYKTSRSISEDPTLAVSYQRSIGSIMKRKLLSSGINLFDQNINKQRAQQASTDPSGSVVTLDLERASDSIAYKLVEELLPWDWFLCLEAFRSSHIKYNKDVFVLEKFSSMGNGYTFELESLIFFSLAYAIQTHFEVDRDIHITVYGDDIICGRNLGELILTHFPLFGFTVNEEKSCFTPGFRESCGGDYSYGLDVRPFFVKERLSFKVLFSYYNFLMGKPHFDVDREIRDLILSVIPSKLKLFGPAGFGDGHLVSNADMNTYLKRKKIPGTGRHSFSFYTMISVPIRNIEPLYSDYLLPLYTIGLSERASNPYYALSSRKVSPRFHREWANDPFDGIPFADSIELDHYVLRMPKGVRISAQRTIVRIETV